MKLLICSLLVLAIGISCNVTRNKVADYYYFPAMQETMFVADIPKNEEVKIKKSNCVYVIVYDTQKGMMFVSKFDSLNRIVCNLKYKVREDVLSEYKCLIELPLLEKKMTVVTYKQPLLHTEQKWYHKNGLISRNEFYWEGIEDSIWSYYNSNGVLVKRDTFYRIIR